MPEARKIAVAGATGRVGRHVVDVLETEGHDVVPISRSSGVDVVTGEGLPEALTGVEAVIDVATGPSPEQKAATEFFTSAARNLHEAGERAGVRRMVVVSIIGTDRFTAGYGVAKVAHEQAMLAGPDPGADPARGAVPRVRRADRGLGDAGRRELRAEDAHAAGRRPDRRPGACRPRPAPNRSAQTNGTGTDPGDRRSARGEPRRRGDAARRPARRPSANRRRDRPDDPDHDLYEAGALFPGPGATLAGPTFAEWLDSAGTAAQAA